MTSNSDDETPNRHRLWRLVGVAGLLAVPLLVIWWPGCREYPAVTSKESLNLMKLLYTACNTEDQKRLAEVERGVEKLTRKGKMTTAEREGFEKIIGMAKSGDWEIAEKAAFKFAQDQVGVGHPDPHPHDHGKIDKEGKATKGRAK